MKLFFWQKVLLVLLLLGLGVFLFFVFFRDFGFGLDGFLWGRFFLFFGVFLVSSLLVFFLPRFFRDGDEGVVDGFVRVPVSVRRARLLIRRGLLFCGELGVPVVVDVDGFPRPGFGWSLFFGEGREWVSRSTGDRYYALEFFLNRGFFRGWNLLLVRLDRGEDWIVNNLFSNFFRLTSMRTWKRVKGFPMDAPASEEARFRSFMTDALLDGVSPSDLKAFEGLSGRGVFVDDDGLVDDGDERPVAPVDKVDDGDDVVKDDFGNKDAYRESRKK